MRKRFLVPAIALLVGAASSPLWLVSAADSVSMARLNADVSLESDADYLTGFVPTRTTIGSVFDHHMIDGPEKAVLVAAIGETFDLRRIRAGQPYLIDRMFDGRVRRFEYEIDADRRLTATRGSLEGTPRFHTAIEQIPKETSVVTVEGTMNVCWRVGWLGLLPRTYSMRLGMPSWSGSALAPLVRELRRVHAA